MADEVRRIFVDMGFQEIDEEYVQPAFWNMDALFTPQDHPARELQDTFYLKNPSESTLEDDDIVSKVCSMHECGGETGSLGWRYGWCREESERALLRTHTTVNTIRHLWQNPDPPVKVFSLSKVFRKEAIDATHLPEFTQIEGIVMEKDASFDMLCGDHPRVLQAHGLQRHPVPPRVLPVRRAVAGDRGHVQGQLDGARRRRHLPPGGHRPVRGQVPGAGLGPRLRASGNASVGTSRTCGTSTSATWTCSERPR